MDGEITFFQPWDVNVVYSFSRGLHPLHPRLVIFRPFRAKMLSINLFGSKSFGKASILNLFGDVLGVGG
jgi:hypothetical protein